jgi:pyrroloquinoline-quinone synthase
MLNTGKATPEQIRGWVGNRFYYQISIPLKDAAILANCSDRAVRRTWVQRILDHDGHGDDPGGIESWLRLAEAVGLERTQVESLGQVLPGVRFAVDAYVNFARRAPWEEGVCASLTELFAPEIHRQRLASWPQHYPWIEAEPNEPCAPRRGIRIGAGTRSLHDTRRAGARAAGTAVQAGCTLADE